MPQDTRSPVTVLTGFLGSGKTTLLNALVHERGDLRIAVIVNEFGLLGIDASLIESTADDVIQLSNGCLCCSVRGDLLTACERLARRRDDFDWLVVETSGLADPAPIAATFLLAEGPGEVFRLDGLVATVDARNVAEQFRQSETVSRQIALADRIILTKMDIADNQDCDRIIARVRLINGTAEIVHSSADQPAVSALLDLGAYDLGNLPAQVFLAPAPRHDGNIRSESFEFTRPLDFTAFSVFIKRLLAANGEDVLRVKGILDLAGEDRRFAFHCVQTVIDGDVIGPWGDAPRLSRLVFIGRNLDRSSLEAALYNCIS